MNDNNIAERISHKLSLISQELNDRKRRFWIGAVLMPIVLIMIGVIAYLYAQGKSDHMGGNVNVIVTPENIDEVYKSTNNKVTAQPDTFETVMTTNWHFKNGDAISEDAYVQNVINNTNDVYVDVVMANDESKIIYTSPLIPRGSYLEKIVLNETVEAGTYDCIAIYHLLDDSGDSVSTLKINITIDISE